MAFVGSQHIKVYQSAGTRTGASSYMHLYKYILVVIGTLMHDDDDDVSMERYPGIHHSAMRNFAKDSI